MSPPRSSKRSPESTRCPSLPHFVLHTGDLTHLAKPDEFDAVAELLKEVKAGKVLYVPGEHDFDGDGNKEYLKRYGKGTTGTGWYSFDYDGVHFIGLVNVANAKSGSGDGGLGVIGKDQLEWLKKDVDGLKDSNPVVVFAHVPLWTVYEKWGWGTRDSEQALKILKRFGSLTVLNGHIHQVLRKVEGKVTFHTARSTAFPQSEPGKGSPGPIRDLPAEKLKAALGLSAVSYVENRRLTRHRGFHARMTNRTARSKRNSPQRFLSTFHGTGGTCSRRRSCNTYLPREGRCAMKKMKKWWLAAAVSLAVFAGFGAGIAKAQPSPPVRDIGGEVRGVFATRCAGCHGPDLAKPKGRFGYVLDLRRIAANPEMVIPATTDRVRAVDTRPGGRDAPDRLAARSAHAGAKGSHSGMDRRWCPGRFPRCLGFPSFSPIRTDDPSTHRDGPGGSVHPLAGQVSPATAPLPDCSCPGGWGRRDSVGVATKSDSVGISSILLMARGSCRDPDSGAGVAVRSGRERSGFASTLDGPPLARDERCRVAAHRSCLRRTRCPPRGTKSRRAASADVRGPHHRTHCPPRRSARTRRRLLHLLAQLTHPHFQVGMSTGKATGKATHQRLGQKGAAHVGQMVADRTPNSAHTNASVTRLTL